MKLAATILAFALLWRLLRPAIDALGDFAGQVAWIFIERIFGRK